MGKVIEFDFRKTGREKLEEIENKDIELIIKISKLTMQNIDSSEVIEDVDEFNNIIEEHKKLEEEHRKLRRIYNYE